MRTDCVRWTFSRWALRWSIRDWQMRLRQRLTDCAPAVASNHLNKCHSLWGHLPTQSETFFVWQFWFFLFVKTGFTKMSFVARAFLFLVVGKLYSNRRPTCHCETYWRMCDNNDSNNNNDNNNNNATQHAMLWAEAGRAYFLNDECPFLGQQANRIIKYDNWRKDDLEIGGRVTFWEIIIIYIHPLQW